MTRQEFMETGGKAANRGELTNNGFNVPPGFCVTGKSLDSVIDAVDLWPRINSIIETMDFDDYEAIEVKAEQIREIIVGAPIPGDLKNEISTDVAGVMFTANAVSSARDEIVIESNWGLGESLVSGEAIVDYFVMTREDPPQIKVKKVQTKNIMVTIDREKGIGRKKYDLSPEMSTTCSLTDEQLVEPATIGPRIEEFFGYPQDIEWAYENNELFFLQSRKIKGLKN